MAYVVYSTSTFQPFLWKIATLIGLAFHLMFASASHENKRLTRIIYGIAAGVI